MVTIYRPIVKAIINSVTYTCSHDGINTADYQTNGAQRAHLTIDNSDGSITWGDIACEQTCVLKVNDGSSDYTLMDGYVTAVERRLAPDYRREICVDMIDYGGYLAAKVVGEKKYTTSTTAATIFTDAAALVTGVTTNIDANTTAIKKTFDGTYVKDMLAAAAEIGGAEYFFDESKVLQAFAHGGRALTTGGHNYKLLDTTASNSWERKILFEHSYSFKTDATQRFRSVTATTGITATFPHIANLHLLTTDKVWVDWVGKNFSTYFHLYPYHDYDQPSTVDPIRVVTSGITLDGGASIPALSLSPASTAQLVAILIQPEDLSQYFPLNIDFKIPLDAFTELRFFMRNSLATETVTDITLGLFDDDSNYWQYKIKHNGGSYLGGASVSAYNDLTTSGGGWAYLRYYLPTSTSDSLNWSLTPASWTKTGTPTEINYIDIRVTPETGYTGSLDFAQFYLYGKNRATVTGAGSPATKKIIVNRSIKDLTTLTNLATKEQARCNTNANRSKASIMGDTVFIKPGYIMDIDFTTKLGAGASGTGLRIAKISHDFTPRWITTLDFDNAFARV